MKLPWVSASEVDASQSYCSLLGCPCRVFLGGVYPLSGSYDSFVKASTPKAWPSPYVLSKNVMLPGYALP